MFKDDKVFNVQKALAKEKELKEHPERDRVQAVTLTPEELYNKIIKNGGSYDIEGGILTLVKYLEKNN